MVCKTRGLESLVERNMKTVIKILFITAIVLPGVCYSDESSGGYNLFLSIYEKAQKNVKYILDNVTIKYSAYQINQNFGQQHWQRSLNPLNGMSVILRIDSKGTEKYYQNQYYSNQRQNISESSHAKTYEELLAGKADSHKNTMDLKTFISPKYYARLNQIIMSGEDKRFQMKPQWMIEGRDKETFQYMDNPSNIAFLYHPFIEKNPQNLRSKVEVSGRYVDVEKVDGEYVIHIIQQVVGAGRTAHQVLNIIHLDADEPHKILSCQNNFGGNRVKEYIEVEYDSEGIPAVIMNNVCNGSVQSGDIEQIKANAGTEYQIKIEDFKLGVIPNENEFLPYENIKPTHEVSDKIRGVFYEFDADGNEVIKRRY